MSILKTTQTIKVKVSANGGITPIPTGTPVVLKNTVREELFLSQLADVTPNTSANGSILVFNTSTGKYEAKIVATSLEDISNFDSAPQGQPAANGSIVVYNTETGNYEVRPIELSLGQLTDVEASSPSEGFMLVYNAQTGKYDVRGVNYNVSELNDVSGTPIDGATLVFDEAIGKFVIKILDHIPAIDGATVSLAIKTTTDAQPNELANGELAYSTTSNNLYIGNGGAVRLLSGEEFLFVSRARPGILTANAAIVADENLFVDAINTQSIRIGANDQATEITSVGTFANSTQLGNTAYGSNNELVTSYAIKTYVDSALSSVAIPTTPYALPIANGSALGGVKVGDGLTIDSITGVLSVTGGGSSYTLPTASEGTLGGIKVGAGLAIDGDGVVSVTDINGNIGVTVEGAQDAAANLFLNGSHTGITFAYDDVNQAINATVTGGGGGATNLNALTDVALSGVTNNHILVYDQGSSQWRNRQLIGTADQISVSTNASGYSISLTNNVIIPGNTSIGQQLQVGNAATFANTVDVTGGLISRANVSVHRSLSVNGTATFSNTVLINSSLDVINYANFANSVDITKTLSVGRQATFANTVRVEGATTVNNSVTINNNLNVAHQTTTQNLVSNNIHIEGGIANIIANTAITGDLVVDGNIQLGTTNTSKIFVSGELASNVIPDANNIYSLGSPERRFKDVYVSGGTIYVDQLEMSSPPGGGLLVSGNMSVDGNANVTGNTSLAGSLDVTGSSNLAANVTLGTTNIDLLTINSSIDSSLIPSTNAQYDVGNTSSYFNEAYLKTLNSQDGYFAGNVEVNGNLTVLGDFTTLSVQSVSVEDPIIKLAGNNNADAVDIGFYGRFNSNNTVQYAGLMRDASDGKFRLFSTEQEPQATVDTDDASYQQKTLIAFVESGGLLTNSSYVGISSNSSVTVSIQANTLTLSTPLDVVSGGTGRSSISNNAILRGNGTGALEELTGTEGQVLQIINGKPTFGHIDCGYY